MQHCSSRLPDQACSWPLALTTVELDLQNAYKCCHQLLSCLGPFARALVYVQDNVQHICQHLCSWMMPVPQIRSGCRIFSNHSLKVNEHPLSAPCCLSHGRVELDEVPLLAKNLLLEQTCAIPAAPLLGWRCSVDHPKSIGSMFLRQPGKPRGK